MKKVYVQIAIYTLVVVGGLVLTACEKEEEKLPTQEAEVAVSDNNIGMVEMDDILAIAEDAMRQGSMANTRISGEEQVFTNYCGATVNVTTADDGSGNIIIDFGTTGHSCNDGRTRQGKIRIESTGKYREAGKGQVITLDGYYVNGNKIEGTKYLAHKWADNKTITTIVVADGKIIYPDKSVIEWKSTRNRVWDTKGTIAIADDEIFISGSANGKTRGGVAFRANIDAENPLVLKASCLSSSGTIPVGGILRVNPLGGTERVVNYGNGSCDRRINVSMSGQSADLTIQ